MAVLFFLLGLFFLGLALIFFYMLIRIWKVGAEQFLKELDYEYWLRNRWK